MALYTFNDNVQVNAPKHIDTRYMNLFSPYANVAAANAAIPSVYRYLGLTVLVGTSEYWYQAGITDPDLVLKGGGGGGLLTADNGLTANTATNVQLGGGLVTNTSINQGTNTMTWTGNVASGDMFSVQNTVAGGSGYNRIIMGQAIAVFGTKSLTAVYGGANGSNTGTNIGGEFSGDCSTGTNAYGVYATSGAGIGVYGASHQNIGVLGALTSGTGGVAVKGDGSAVPASTGGYFIANDGYGVIAERTDSSGGSLRSSLQVVRSGAAYSGGYYGTSIEYKINNSAGTGVIASDIQTFWNVGTAGSEDAGIVIDVLSGGSLVSVIQANVRATNIFGDLGVTAGTHYDNVTNQAGGTYVIAATDFVVIGTGTTSTWTMPTPSKGRRLILTNHGTGNITLSTNVTIANGTTSNTISAGTTYQLIHDGSIWRKIN